MASAATPGVEGRREPTPRMPSHRTIPIVEHARVDIGTDRRRELHRLAARIIGKQPALNRTSPFGSMVKAGLGRGPLAVIEDHGAIQRVGPRADLLYGHRAMALAGDSDTVLLADAPNPHFVTYCRDVLSLGGPEFLAPTEPTMLRPLAMRCADDSAVVGALANRARRYGELTVVPYMGTGGAWRLAGEVSRASGVETRVAAPPPNLTQHVNDKLWFARLIDEVLGLKAAPPYFAAYGPAGLVACMRRLARDHQSVAVKLPSSASGIGNAVLSAREVLDSTPSDLAARLVDQLRLDQEPGAYPVMACAWKHAIVATPSVQTWIGHPQDGDPVFEGVFDQALSGQRGTFVGAVPSSLDTPWIERLCREAMAIALILQDLGYFGRCSFDAILVDSSEHAAQAHWIECNGRWGGVSLPMTLVNRLTGDWANHPFVVIETRTRLRRARRFDEVLETVGEDLFRPGDGMAGAIFLSPARLELGTGIDAVVVDTTIEAAQERADRLVAQLSEDGA